MSEMEEKAKKQNFWRRCQGSACKMEEWHLQVLLFMSNVSLWGLCAVLVPCAPSLLAVLSVGILVVWWPDIKAKGTSVGKSCWKRSRKKPRGASDPWEGVEGSTESLKAGWGKPREGEWWESHCSGEARNLPWQTGDMGHGGSFSSDTSSELLENQPSTTDTEELARSLMESLDITQICLDLLGKLKDSQDSGAPVLREGIRREYPICLQCRQCLMGSEPAAEEDRHTLAACLRTADILVHEEDLQLEMGLGFELAVGGEPVYAWEITQRLPEIPPERCCEECEAPLPRGPGDSESSQTWFAVPEAQGTPTGEMRPAGQDARQSWSQRSDTSSAELEEDGQEEPLPSVDSTWPLPPYAQPLSPGAPDRLQRVGEEPLPSVGYKGLGWGLSLQCVRQCWSELKASVRRSTEAGQRWLQSVASSDEEEDETLPSDLQFKVHALFHAMAVEV